jgi:flagellar biosynthetic protein FliQ
MDPSLAVDLGREALYVTTIISAPILIAGVVVGLVIGLAQALTQIQEQTVAFVPKLVAMVLALAFTLPWILGQLVEYSENLIRDIPGTL